MLSLMNLRICEEELKSILKLCFCNLGDLKLSSRCENSLELSCVLTEYREEFYLQQPLQLTFFESDQIN